MPDGNTMTQPLAERYGDVAPRLPGAGLGWLDALRRDGLARYGALGLPGPRVEAWKYTNLNRLRRTAFVPAALADAPALAALPAGVLAVDAPRVVLVNGRLRADLSDLDRLPAGIEVSGLAALLDGDPARLEGRLGQTRTGHDMPLLALNDAFLADGVVISVAPGAKVATPLHLVSIGVGGGETPVAFHPRALVQVGANARATLIESHVGGAGAYLSNGVVEIRLDAGAVLAHRKLQNEGAAAYHIAATSVAIAEDARYESFVLQVGGRLARNEIHATLDGTGAECRLYGSYAGRGDQHIDNTTNIDHAAPGGTSREVYKGALDDNARGVFQGKILVRRDAQKTDGHQLNKALLLSAGSEIDSKPELEIYADDVKCSHGATAGELDEEQLFYLRSRGIDEAEARDLLVAAFLEDGLAVIEDADQAEAFRAVIAGWLAERRARQEA